MVRFRGGVPRVRLCAAPVYGVPRLCLDSAPKSQGRITKTRISPSFSRPAKATSRTPGLHTPEDSNFDLGLLQGSETHRSTCGPAQAKHSTQTRRHPCSAPPIVVSVRRGGAGWDRDHIWGRTREDRVLSNNPNHTLGRTEGHSDPPRSCLGSCVWGPAAAWEPRLWFRRGLGVPDGTKIILGVVRVRTECSPTTPIVVSVRRGGAGWDRDHIWGRTREDRVLSNNPNHTLGRTEGHSDPPRSCLGSCVWGPAAAWEPRLWFRRGLGVPDGTKIILGVVRVRTECSPTTPIMVSARREGAGTRRDHIWGYSALARAKPVTDDATEYAVSPLKPHRNARKCHTLCPTSPGQTPSRTPSVHRLEDSNDDLGFPQGSATHRSTCGPAQTKRFTQTR